MKTIVAVMMYVINYSHVRNVISCSNRIFKKKERYSLNVCSNLIYAVIMILLQQCIENDSLYAYFCNAMKLISLKKCTENQGKCTSRI